MATFLLACDPWGVSVERVEVKNLSVAREMVKSLAVEAQASREVRTWWNITSQQSLVIQANGLLIMQKGEGRSLEKIK